MLLTIDNSDGLLPIEYSEVTIARTLFRNGGSEYAINGENCRLLDVQELLSDTGLGREMHVIVGQGQLDKVLHATPEDRRGFIEEAAGILKHRRRKEKTLRKLDAMQTNLTRLSDLAGEIRRQLKPLGRQAEVARKAQSVAAVFRDAKARILADDVVRLRRELHDHQEVEAGRKSERIVLTERLDQTRVRQQHVEQSMVGDDVDRARTVVHRLESVQGAPPRPVEPGEPAPDVPGAAGRRPAAGPDRHPGAGGRGPRRGRSPGGPCRLYAGRLGDDGPCRAGRPGCPRRPRRADRRAGRPGLAARPRGAAARQCRRRRAVEARFRRCRP
ncbi:hypothetical protein Q9Q99_05200 [Curtobacterium flaccumfaciens]|nr:hypothetical protein Q9Q99_05200 [Curtobacterium flaccumfaciens]